MASAGTDSSYQDPIAKIGKEQCKDDLPDFRPGDTVKVHMRIIEGEKERIQIFEGIVLKRHKGTRPNATFTVRKISYNIGVERTFPLHSPRIAKIEVINLGEVRRARLFYLRGRTGKAARVRTKVHVGKDDARNSNGTKAAAIEIEKPTGKELPIEETAVDETSKGQAPAGQTE